MEISLKRHYREGEVLDGILRIGDEIICETSEHALTAIAEGTYPVTMVACAAHGKVMPVLGEPMCERCRVFADKPLTGINSLTPIRCPMLKPGNGVVGRKDGSICVGMHPRDEKGKVLHGMLLRPVGVFEKVLSRLKGTKKIQLKIENY